MQIKSLSWNVNGMRAILKKGFWSWFLKEKPDVLSLQETKVWKKQLTEDVLVPKGYETFWAESKRPGYSGVSIWVKKKTFSRFQVQEGLGIKEIDQEGRVLTFESDLFIFICAYFPNSGRDLKRLSFKLIFCQEMESFLKKLQKKGKPLFLVGDYNIAHQPIDLANPDQNKNHAGFLPQERTWMEQFLKKGFIDAFRKKHPEKEGHYTWWSYRKGVRERNIGWRLDYHCLNQKMFSLVKDIYHQPQVYGSDHCPIGLLLKWK